MEADFVTLADLFHRRDEGRLTQALLARAPSEDRVPAMVRFALSDASDPRDITPRSALEAAVLAQIGALHDRARMRTGTGAESAWHTPRSAPRLFDGLAKDGGAAGWSTAQWLNMLQLRHVMPTTRVAVVATIRDEALGLVEWVAHYRCIGIERIFIYTNDNVDGTDALLECLAGHGLVAPIRNDVSLEFSPQRKAYAHALHLLPELRDSEWALFVDADEFLIPADGMTLDAWLAEVDRRPGMKPPSGILFDWRWHVSGGRYAWEPGLVLRRFPHVRPHGGFKSLVRLADTLCMRQVHFPEVIDSGVIVDSDLREVPRDGVWRMPPASGAGGWINHYWSKSFEEFSVKKARGDTLAAHNHAEWSRDFALFFAWNGPETAATLAPPPEELVARVAAEHDRIMALPGVAGHVAAAVAALGPMLARFDAVGGLQAIHERLRPAALA